jgi:uncharacterized membrane protein
MPSFDQEQNVSGEERLVSVAAGSILALLGIARCDVTGWVVAGVGAALVYRGATGHCSMYESLGINTAHERPQRIIGAQPQSRRSEKHGVHVAVSLLIDRSPEELYAYWRNFANLPTIMTHLESVEVLGGNRSHWVAKAPSIVGGKVEWDAEITADEPNSRIAWRSLPGADVENDGSVQFKRALGDRGTAVRVVVDYVPPAGRVGKWVAKLFGEEPEQQIWYDLRNFKHVMETGEIPTTVGQPRGTCAGRGIRSPRMS